MTKGLLKLQAIFFVILGLFPLCSVYSSSINPDAKRGEVIAPLVAPTFYRAINLNGAALSIDGNSWEASASAANFSSTQGGTFANQAVTLIPSTDANRATMIRSSIYGSSVTVTVSAIPTATYDIYFYVWEDNVSETYSVTVEGQPVLINHVSGSAGTWNKLGPFRTSISDGAINASFGGGTANVSGIEVWTSDLNLPVISNPIPDQNAVAGSAFNYTFPSNTFTDPDAGTTLTYTAALADGSALPSWLTFNGSTLTFSGTPLTANAASLNVKVIANDNSAGTVTDYFTLTVNLPGNLTFYRAVNLNGATLTIDGVTFTASASATNFTTTNSGSFANQNIILTPPTDANRADMIRSSVYGNTVSFIFSSVPNGTYDVWLYAWEDDSNQTYSVSLEGTTLYSYSSGVPGTWNKLGPFRAAITDGTINLSTSGGLANLSGIEIRTVGTNNPPVVSTVIPDQTAIAGSAFNYTFPSNTFTDPDAGTTLTYTASLADGSALPTWLTFNGSTRTFSGTPLTANAGTLNVKVTANDNSGGTVTDNFTLTVNLSAPTFYRAVNLNGTALTIDAHSFEAGASAVNFSTTQGGAFENQAVTLIPATDANRATMIRSSIYGSTVTLAMAAVPNATYDVYFYVWEDNSPETYSLSVEGQPVLSNFNSGSTGTWNKLGPFRTAITDGTINAAFGGGTANVSGMEVWASNVNLPVIANPIPDQNAVAGSAFNYTFPANTFTDPDAGTTLTYTATLANGSALPSWLTFNGSTRTFSGTPLTANAASLNVKVTANDNSAGTVSDYFTLTVNLTGSLTFYRGVNLNGTSMTIDGATWEASASAANFSTTNSGSFANQAIALMPPTDANRATMIRSSVYGNTVNFTFSSVPNGTYDVWLYSWEDDTNQTYSVSLEGTVMLANHQSGAVGTWNKLGPFRSVISDGTINLGTTGGLANLSGIEIFSIAAVTGVTVSPTAVTIGVGQTSQLTPTVIPANANQNVTWSSSNTSIATVNTSGLVTAVAVGNATITVTTAQGGFTATSSITVQSAIAATGVTVAPTPLNLTVGQTGQLTRTMVPANASNQNVTWSSNNTAIATVNTSGLVTAVANGFATITVTTAQGGYTATSLVQVGGTPDVLIPAALLVSPEGRPALPLIEGGPFTLTALALGTNQQVFPAPPCLVGQYYVGFQLYYDLGNTQTQQDWTVDLGITLLNNTTEMWKKSVSVRSTDQTFISTVFHDVLLSCDPNYKIRIDVRNINGPAPQNNIYLKFLLYKNHENQFVPATTATLNCANASEKSSISWTYSGQGATAYDLEWVFIANHEGFTGTTAQQAFLFKEPVRITTAALSYAHATFYPTGKLAYRVRAVGYDPQFPGHRIPGAWSYTCGLISLTNPQADLTWQEQTVFAEDGKNKKIISYYDKSMRKRQSQTSLSTSQDTTVVGETLYDFEGRQAVDILAVPAASVSLKYKPAFNAFTAQHATVTANTSARRKKFHYDNDVLTNSILSTADGAGRYYSPANSLNAFRKDYIPDGEGYVFSQTEYLNDGTGRVKRQSGVGKEFRMDGGRPTRFFYANAAPVELIRLFGSNVGNAAHYKKNMSVDPNGQSSVSYLDQEGRVVATALAGSPPSGVDIDPLASYVGLSSDQLVVDISSKNRKQDNLSFNGHKILNTVPNTQYTFVYNLSSLGSTLQDFGCVSCTYDLKITITDPDGGLVTLPVIAGNDDGNNLSYLKRNISIANCITPTVGSNITFVVNFTQLGDYTINKVLTPIDLTFDQAKVIITQSAAVQTKIQDVQNAHVVDASNCEICVESITEDVTCPEAEAVIASAILEITDQDCENIRQQIIQALLDAPPVNAPEDYPTATDIANHPRYCEYTFCVASKSGDAFEKTMARATNWTQALSNGYTTLAALSTNPYPDPYFRSGAPGSSYTASLQNKLNAVYIGTVAYDSDGDGIQNGTNDYTGTILQVTDPLNTTFYIDQNGNHTTSTTAGKHILYSDLMARRAANQISETNYQAELLKMRWGFFRSFYLEAKRKTRLEMPEVQGCPSVKSALEAPGLLPTTEAGIIDFGNQNYATVPVSTAEIQATYAAITLNCSGTISAADKTTIETRLQNYFNEKPNTLLRFILTADVGVNTHLNAIQTILTAYGCGSLSTYAVVDPLTCISDTTITYPNNFVPQTGGGGSQLRMASTNEASTESSNSAKSPLKESTAKPLVTNDSQLPDWQKAIMKERRDILSKEENVRLAEPPPIQTVNSKSKQNTGFSPLVSPPPSQAEYNALLALYNATGGPNWTTKVGWSTANPTTPQDVSGWTGVTVDANGHVTDLSLSANNLTGTLPAAIGKLTYLSRLQLTSNSIGGNIPPSIGKLSALYELYLSNNQLTGNIPDSLYKATLIGYLDLSSNQLTGSLSSNVSQLSQLRYLYLFWNQLSGALPASLSTMTSVERVWAFSNQFTGTIPSISGMTSLQELNLSTNSFSAQNIPASVYTRTTLKVFSCHDCNLTGSISSTITSLTNLEALELSNNDLTGTIPSNIGTLNKLKTIGLSGNAMTGIIPASFKKLTALQSFFADFNQFTGGLPLGFGKLASLRVFWVYNNAFSGTIPDSIRYLSNLQSFIVSNNQFTGQIPAGVSNMPVLQSFYVDFNKLNGAVPVFPTTTTSVAINNNKYTFADFLPSKTPYTGAAYYYTPQDSVDVKKNVIGTEASTVTLTTTIDRSTTPASLYQWFQDVAGPTDVALNTASTTGHTVVLSNLSLTDSGKKYYYKITNPSAGSLTLISRPQTLIVNPATTKTVTICNQYDANNPTLQKFSYTIDWNQVVQKCMADAAAEQTQLIAYAVDKLIEEEATTYYTKQRTNCLTNTTETLTYSYLPKEYHYTLYYFDQAGNLAQTVPPEGVRPAIGAEPQHAYITRYQYNSLNQIIYQKTPDAGESRMYYNTKGQLRLSQNAQQFKDNNYSYSKYDNQGRIVEVGEMNTVTPLTTLTPQIEDPTFPLAASFTLSDINRTYYDLPAPGIEASLLQTNLRNRVAWVEVLEKNAPDVIATYYSYDIHGNVNSLLQMVPGLGNKRTDYLYDLVSGNVNYVLYQYGQPDQFVHRYKYDADNRLKEVATSNDAYLFDIDAAYRYYLHGPLARVELGQYRVQGLDYYYTLQGWIKGVNVPFAADPGNDGNAGTNLRVGRDVFSYAIGYYESDYKPRTASRIISDTRDQLWTRFKTLMGATNTGLYNGNISWMVTDLKKIGQQKGARVKGMQAMLYKYDQLNRIVQSRSLTSYAAATGFATRTASPAAYDEDFSYDANGNLLTLKRRDNLAALSDDFTYSYYKDTNKLRYHLPVGTDTTYSGAIASTKKIYRNITVLQSAFAPANQNVVIKASNNIDFEPGNFDIQNNATFRAYVLPNDEGNYNYDAIGNLVWDEKEGVAIGWTPSKRIRQINKRDGSVTTFRYDGLGNRIEKKVVKDATTAITRYARDVNGKVIATYNDVQPLEYTVNGNTRLGLYKGGRRVGQRKLGLKNYELANHLDNVLSVVTDNIRMTVDSTWATVVVSSDYYAFGAAMGGRVLNDKTYRYGFNGKEKDDAGEFGSTQYDYGFRIYNPNLGRFLSVDPLASSFPWNSTYAFAENDVIRNIDLDGLEKVAVIYSPYNAFRVRNLLQAKSYKKVNEIVEYSFQNGWVDDKGKPSDYLVRKSIEKDPRDGLSPDYSGIILEDFPLAEYESRFGDINDHGGYMSISYYNFETKTFESLGVLPLSKIKEHESLEVYSGDSFWDVKAVYSKYDIGRELINRFAGKVFEEGGKKFGERLEKVIRGIVKTTKALEGPAVENWTELYNDKLKFAVQGRLRALGPNSAYQSPYYNEYGEEAGTWTYEYQVDQAGNETFTETYSPGVGVEMN